MPKRWFHTLIVCMLAFVAVFIPTPQAHAQNGSLSFELEWNGAADFDLMVQEPDGTWIDYNEPTSATGGTLDASQGNNFCEGVSAAPREGVSWISAAPTGTYWINVSLYDTCGDAEPQPFTLTIAVDGQVVEQVQGVALLENVRVYNFPYPSVGVFSGQVVPSTGQNTEPEPPAPADTPSQSEGRRRSPNGGGAANPTPPPVDDAPANPPADTSANPPAGKDGPINMAGDETVVQIPRGPMRVQLTWASTPAFDLDLMANEMGTMIAYDQPVSDSGATLTDTYGNGFCVGETIPNRDMYGEEIAWPADPQGSALDVYVASIGVCGATGFVLSGDEPADFTLAVYNAQGEALYGPVQARTGDDGTWGVTFQFTE